MVVQAADAIGSGQQWLQIGELLLAFGLSAIIGLERQLRGKSAGLRTQTIVGTSSALILIVSKYGFTDVLVDDHVVLDPSRVAAQIVSGIGFLGAGLIITRRGAIRGLTTAASVWETAAIGMAAGAGLPILAVFVTGLHFLAVFAFTPLGHLISTRAHAERDYTITYVDGRGVLRDLLAVCTARRWTVTSLAILKHSDQASYDERLLPPGSDHSLVTVGLRISGTGTAEATPRFAAVDGVVRVDQGEDEED